MHRKQTNDKSHGDQGLAAANAGREIERPAPRSPADDLFAELDHRQVGDGPSSWVTEVAAIHMVQHEAWVQVAPVGQSSRSVILHLSTRVTPKHVLATLAAFWAQSADQGAPQVIHVLQVV